MIERESLEGGGQKADAEEIDPRDITASFVPLKREGLASTVIDGETVLLNEVTQAAHLLSGTATVVWECFDGSGRIAEVAVDLSEAFGAPLDVVLDDVLTLARQLGAKGLLAGVAAEHHQAPAWTRPQGLPIGALFPPFELPDLSGRPVPSERFRGNSIVAVNWSPRCGYCDRIVPELAELAPDLRLQGIEMVLLSFGSPEENEAKVTARGFDGVVLVSETPGIDAFAGVGTPSAYLLDAEGAVASPLAIGADEVPALARSLVGPDSPAGTPPG